MLKYRNDGKGKWQSHEIYADGYKYGFEFDTIIPGYGQDAKEAFYEYRENFKKHIEELQKFYNENLNEFDARKLIEVDWSGKPV